MLKSNPSHKIILIKPVLITPPPLPPLRQLLPRPLPLLLLPSSLLRDLPLLFGLGVGGFPLLGPLGLQVGFFGGGEVVGGAEGAGFVEAVDGGVEAGGDEEFLDLWGFLGRRERRKRGGGGLRRCLWGGEGERFGWREGQGRGRRLIEREVDDAEEWEEE